MENQLKILAEILKLVRDLDTEKVEDLIQILQREVAHRKLQQKQQEERRQKEFTFTFDVTFRSGKDQMFVGKAFVNSDGFLRPQLFKGMKTRKVPKKDAFRTKGTYTASPGDIIVRFTKGSWVCKGGSCEYEREQYWYLVTEDGREVEVARYDDLDSQQQVICYLRGEISAEQLAK